MKLILAFSVLICVAFSKTIHPDLIKLLNDLVAPHQEKCIEESQIDPDVAKNLFNGHEYPNEKQVRCYFKCLDENLNYYNENGELDRDLLAKAIDHIPAETIHKCVDKFQSETDLCLKSYKVAVCLYDAELDD